MSEDCSELLKFICQMQEEALSKSDEMLREIKELQYKKRQQEYLVDAANKKEIPNISMFSPLTNESMTEADIQNKDELQSIKELLLHSEEKLEKQKEICKSFERLKSFFLSIEDGKLAAYDDNLINYSTKLLVTQEMDRNRISRDLHDSTVQSLTSLGHKIEYCSKLLDKDPVRVKLELQSMIDLNKEIINDMREIIYDLRPMSLNNIGLIATVESFCLHLRRNGNIDVLLHVEGKEQNLSSIVSVTLYRIIQEACNNVLKHAMAKKITLNIIFHEDAIELRIEDNGKGFEKEKVEDKAREDMLHGFGLSTMRERAKLLSGSFTIESKPGSGTKVVVKVPIGNIRKEELYE